ncbi:MAG: hypothetical protein Q27BPR15_01910 [Rhodobacter sp. CACIA14H1]|nr:MAG: hypothetical protein Q27BPR15_01910 [Rhodobacter sp. CACIA14H1]
MAEAILVPQVGQDLTEAKVVELHVKLGDKVKKGDLVAVVESEKASFEVEAFSEGVVISLPWKVGDVATVLEPLMHVGAEGEVVAEARMAVPDPVPPAVPQTVHTHAPLPVSATPAHAPAPAPAQPPAQPQVEAKVSGGDRASPVARRVAADHGLTIGRIAGTGPRGAVVLRDVEAAVAAAPAGGALELRTLQSGQGTPVVFIHGFGADLSSWRPLVARIGLGSPMMALDLPGHGASQRHGAAISRRWSMRWARRCGRCMAGCIWSAIRWGLPSRRR